MKEASIEYECAHCGFKIDDTFPYANEEELSAETWKFCPKCGQQLRIKTLETWQAPLYKYGE